MLFVAKCLLQSLAIAHRNRVDKTCKVGKLYRWQLFTFIHLILLVFLITLAQQLCSLVRQLKIKWERRSGPSWFWECKLVAYKCVCLKCSWKDWHLSSAWEGHKKLTKNTYLQKVCVCIWVLPTLVGCGLLQPPLGHLFTTTQLPFYHRVKCRKCYTRSTLIETMTHSQILRSHHSDHSDHSGQNPAVCTGRLTRACKSVHAWNLIPCSWICCVLQDVISPAYTVQASSQLPIGQILC